MKLQDFISQVKGGMALPLGFENANAPKPEFVTALLAAGGTGLECVCLSDSSFEVRTSMVKNPDSTAFGKMVGNVAVRVQMSIDGKPTESSISVDLGTLAAFAQGGGKTVIMARPALTATGDQYKTKSGQPIYNFVATKVPAFTGDVLQSVETWVSTFQAKVPTT